MKNIILYTISQSRKWTWIEYQLRDDGFYDVIYGYDKITNFCKMCGNNYNCGCKEYKIVSYEEVKKEIRNWNKKEILEKWK